jgi:hypothetical protein
VFSCPKVYTAVCSRKLERQHRSFDFPRLPFYFVTRRATRRFGFGFHEPIYQFAPRRFVQIPERVGSETPITTLPDHSGI